MLYNLLTGEPYLFLLRILMINLFTVSISSGLLTAMNRVNPARASLLEGMGADPRKIPISLYLLFKIASLMKFAQLNRRGFHHSVLEEDTRGRPGKLR